jgi:hypothetical protein
MLMQDTNEFLWIIALVVFGLVFFSSLTGSLKSEKKVPKIGYLIIAIVCGIAVMEAVTRLTIQRTDTGFMQTMLKSLMRIVQWGFGFIGLLMIIGMTISKKKPTEVA